MARPSLRPGLGFAVAGLALFITLGRVLGPSDLLDNEQQRQMAYVMDAIQNHHWIFQFDQDGVVASKPPMFTWLAAGMSMVLGNVDPWGMRSVAFLATIAVAALIHRAALRFGDSLCAFLCSVAYLLSPPVAKQIWLARMDALFPLTITLGAIAAWHAWQTGRGWIWFGLAAAASMLTKGPLGVLLSAAGLGAFVWERLLPAYAPNEQVRLSRTVRRMAAIRFLIGLALFVAISLGWYLLASRLIGPAVYDKLIQQELLRNFDPAVNGKLPGQLFFVPPAMFLSRYFPWSVIVCVALWRAIAHPDPSLKQRRFERFLASWLLLGFIPFCFSIHQRGDLLLPLIVPASLLAGREVYRLLSANPRARNRVIAIGIPIGLAIMVLTYDVLANRLSYTISLRQIQGIARKVKSASTGEFPLTHVDDPFALSASLGSMRPFYYGPSRATHGVFDKNMEMTYDYQAAADLLTSDAAAYVAVSIVPEVHKYLPPSTKIYDLASSPLPGPALHILSNRPTWRAQDWTVFGSGPLKVEMRGVTLQHASGVEFTFAGAGTVQFKNNGPKPITIHVVMTSSPMKNDRTVTLDANQIWSWTVR